MHTLELVSRKQALELGIKLYFTGEPCKYGHVSPRYVAKSYCVECSRASAVKSQNQNPERKRKNQAAYAVRNRGKIKAKYQENKGEYSARSKDYYAKNREEIIERVKKYSSENIEKIRDTSRARYRRDRGKESFKVRSAASNSIRGVVLAIRSNKIKTPEGLRSKVNFNIVDFKLRMESLFSDGMSWENYGEWHVDHIKPIISFLNAGITDISKINAIENLQPLWAADNLRKGGKYNV